MGIGKSTLGKWMSQYRSTDPVSAPQADLARENERLRVTALWALPTAENLVLREEREVLAHIREQYGLSLGSYGRPRMTMELGRRQRP
jgi:transposase